MPLTLVTQCPHCHADRVGFTHVGNAPHPDSNHHGSLFFTCNRCYGPLAAEVTRTDLQSIVGRDMQGDLASLPLKDVHLFPAVAPVDIPAHCPKQVAEAFRQAEVALRSGSPDAAASMGRRAIDVGTKLFAPDLEKFLLNDRINRLAADHRLTPALKDWAHSLRTVGNEALHGVDGVTGEEAAATVALARYVLIYIFTLPMQVQLARGSTG